MPCAIAAVLQLGAMCNVLSYSCTDDLSTAVTAVQRYRRCRYTFIVHSRSPTAESCTRSSDVGTVGGYSQVPTMVQLYDLRYRYTINVAIMAFDGSPGERCIAGSSKRGIISSPVWHALP